MHSLWTLWPVVFSDAAEYTPGFLDPAAVHLHVLSGGHGEETITMLLGTGLSYVVPHEGCSTDAQRVAFLNPFSTCLKGFPVEKSTPFWL